MKKGNQDSGLIEIKRKGSFMKKIISVLFIYLALILTILQILHMIIFQVLLQTFTQRIFQNLNSLGSKKSYRFLRTHLVHYIWLYDRLWVQQLV